MKEKKAADSEAAKTETEQQNGSAADGKKKKKPFWTEKKVEVLVAILLGVTTLLSAWVSWIGSLHSGIQSINFTKSNNAASEGTAEYNVCLQLFIADNVVWNTLSDYYFDLETAKANGDQAQVKLLTDKIDYFAKQNASETLIEAVQWMEKNGKSNPFEMPGINEKYFGSAEEKIEKSHELLAEGQRDNTKGDSYNLVSVIYSLVLFLLGISNVFKNMPNRIAVVAIATAALVFAFFYMLSIPLPTGFEQMNFFEFKR